MLTDKEVNLLIAVLSKDLDNLDKVEDESKSPELASREGDWANYSLSKRGGIELKKYQTISSRNSKVLQ